MQRHLLLTCPVAWLHILPLQVPGATATAAYNISASVNDPTNTTAVQELASTFNNYASAVNGAGKAAATAALAGTDGSVEVLSIGKPSCSGVPVDAFLATASSCVKFVHLKPRTLQVAVKDMNSLEGASASTYSKKPLLTVKNAHLHVL